MNTKLVCKADGRICEVSADYAPPAGFQLVNTGDPYYPPQIADSTLLAHAEGAIAGWDAGCRTATQRKDMERQKAALIERGFTELAAEIAKRLEAK